ncbi:uncharacterized protein LOC105219057 [Zeugodacus cucurbitae]|uniref:uncharacterized protein LOC105219057 n=1 Tax=Zeugodacus cucurbitae TaxID=28588 RepID=UPI0023D90AFB|nr:uncharacterized protein LOC105219057 [Zeugodacus cucurbitae]
MMSYQRSSFRLLLLLIFLCICAECESKKWRSHIKKKSNAPKISATFRTVKPKRKAMTKHHAAPPHKRHPKMNYYHPLPTKWPSHMASALQPTYYMPSSHYPRWRSYHTAPSKSTALKKIDLSPPFMSLPYGGYSMPLRRSDDFVAVDGSSFDSSDALPSTSLVDMSAFNAAMTDGFFDADIPHLPAGGEFLQPEISLGGWTPVDYKSFMADADFSLLNDQLALNRRLDMDELMYSNPYEMHFI